MKPCEMSNEELADAMHVNALCCGDNDGMPSAFREAMTLQGEAVQRFRAMKDMIPYPTIAVTAGGGKYSEMELVVNGDVIVSSENEFSVRAWSGRLGNALLKPKSKDVEIPIEPTERGEEMSKEEAMAKYDLIPRPVIEVIEVRWGWGTATLSINGAQLEVDRAQWDAVESTF